MRKLNPDFDTDSFFLKVKRARNPVLLLDYDGTLAPFRVERDKAVPYPGVRERLQELQQAQRGRLALISGRAVSDLLPLLNLDPPPEIWGSHGLERRSSDGKLTTKNLTSHENNGLQQAQQWIAAQNLQGASERKAGSVTVHWRGESPDRAREMAERAEASWSTIAADSGLVLKPFDGGLELRVATVNKGDAVRQILAEMPEDNVAAFLGDDLTDEDGFSTIKKHNGAAILVRAETRPTVADLQIEPPEELLAFLERWLDCISQNEPI